MCLPSASRAYRRSFSANYRALFPDNARLYRVDVLETSLDQHSEIWVNGDKFELSPEAMGHAEALQQAWMELIRLLDRWQSAPPCGQLEVEEDDGPPRPSRAELASALVALDVAWAQFECKYIGELIAIEEKARQLIVKAASFESQLRMTPDHLVRDGEYRDIERQLVKCIAYVNSVANFKCKGRDDLGHDILVSAKRIVREVEADRVRFGEEKAEARAAAYLLATEVVASFDAMRGYLRQASTCMERVDPHLCNNPGLVSRLVDWETSWEVGARYVRDAPLLDGICDVVSEVRAAQQVAPALTSMCEDCDVELFLVLPRIVILLFVADPGQQRANLVRNLLPHRFAGAGAKGAEEDGSVPTRSCPELIALSELYQAVLTELASVHPAAAAHAAPKEAAWQVLVKRAIKGDSDGSPRHNATDEDKLSSCPSATRRNVEDFMLGLERWSLELQRHCPQDWNQCSAVLVQCITGTMKTKTSSKKFQI